MSNNNKAPKVDAQSIKDDDDKEDKQSVATSNDGDNDDDKSKGAKAKDDNKSKNVKSNNDDDKHDGRDHGDGDHNDDGHTDNGQSGTSKFKSKDEDEHSDKDDDKSKDKAKSDNDGESKDDKPKNAKSNNDDDKHDGRDHGDGDHNDDGHSDNGQSGKNESEKDKDEHGKDGDACVGDELTEAEKAEAKALAEAEAKAQAEAEPESLASVESVKVGTDLLIDGSFEQANVAANTWTHQKTVGGWQSDSEVEVWGKGFYGIKATEGDKFAELDFDGKQSNIYQDVKTEAGAEYTFSFDAMNRPDSKQGSDTVVVFWNGEEVGRIEPGKEWSNAEFKVTGTGGTDRIEFREDNGDNDSYGGLIDNAKLVKSGLSTAEQAEAEAAKPAIQLAAEDIVDAWTGQTLTGSNDTDGLNGGAGDDDITGKKGNDVINGDDVGSFTADLKIAASISDDSAVRLVVGGMPEGAMLSAGVDNGDGTWTLTSDDLAGLQITSPDANEFSLQIKAVAADGRDLSASTEIKVTFLGGFDDVIQGGQGADVLNGQAGDDIIYGGSKPTGVATAREPVPGDDDTIDAGEGNDVVYAGSGNDLAWGGAGNDWISGGRGDDMVAGNAGDDTLSGNTGDDSMWGDEGNDLVIGGSGNDTLSGHTGDDTLRGGSGDDVFYTDAGNDQIFGGAGFDTLVMSSWSGDTGSYVVDLSQGIVGNSDVGFDTLSSIEAVVGGYGNDLMQGSTKANSFDGGAGDDVLRGGAGADTLTGGEGDDLFLFLGKDVAKLGGGSLGTDTITDFQVGDVVDLSDVTSTRKATYSLKDDGQNTTIVAQIKGQAVEVAVLENFSGQTLDDMIANGMLIV